MKPILTAAFIILHTFVVYAQQVPLHGKVTYISSQFHYVQFDNTKGIQVGDTLFSIDKAAPAAPVLVVKFLSSRSVAAELLTVKPRTVGEVVVAYPHHKTQNISPEEPAVTTINTSSTTPGVAKVSVSNAGYTKVSGRFTTQISSDITENSKYSNTRYRGSFNISIENAGMTGLKFTNYMSYSMRSTEWKFKKSAPLQNLRLYDAAFTYGTDSSYTITAGRHLNYHMSGLGAIDGLQFESGTSWFRYGIAAGSRPSLTDYGFDINLFQAGAFISQNGSSENGEYENTLALFNQTNHYKTDRRFLYFQHSNTLLPKLYLFASNEWDLYEVNNGTAKTKVSLTGLYLMSRYSPIKELTATFSYDARKNAQYYETYKNLLSSFTAQPYRHSFRFSLNSRPLANLTLGLNTGYRFQNNDINRTRDYGLYLYYYNLPYIQTDFSANAAYILSSYNKGISTDCSFSKTVLETLYIQTGVRLFHSTYLSLNTTYNQTTLYSSVSYPITDYITSSLYYEGSFEKNR